jgi:hypothetical protein
VSRMILYGHVSGGSSQSWLGFSSSEIAYTFEDSKVILRSNERTSIVRPAHPTLPLHLLSLEA